MNPLDREIIDQLVEALEQVKSTARSAADIDTQLVEIKESLASIDRILRGHEDMLGLISRVQTLERAHNFIRVLLGAFVGSSVTLLAAYISNH